MGHQLQVADFEKICFKHRLGGSFHRPFGDNDCGLYYFPKPLEDKELYLVFNGKNTFFEVVNRQKVVFRSDNIIECIDFYNSI